MNDTLRKSYRCFFCDDVFTNRISAEVHFGRRLESVAACQIGGEHALLKLLRDQEDQLARYRAEDSDALRAMHAQSADHQVALRREEEKGYARGLQDARKVTSAHDPVAITAEHVHALRLANTVLDRPNADPDDELGTLARALWRQDRSWDSLRFAKGEVAAWASQTFPRRTPQGVFLKMFEELGELVNDPKSPGELADVLIMVLDLAAMNDINVGMALRDKMAVNYKRTWAWNEEMGIAQHVGEDR